jgi:hypothetical protein
MPNGTCPHTQGGQSGGTPATGLLSPRLGPHPHNAQTSCPDVRATFNMAAVLCKFSLLVLRGSYALYVSVPTA